MNHLTDEQLNEYLDEELQDRSTMDDHLAACADCAARLDSLQQLFTDLASLPDAPVSRPVNVNAIIGMRRAVAMPRPLQVAAGVQMAAVIATILLAAPIIIEYFIPRLPVLPDQTIQESWAQMQSQWLSWVDLFSSIQIPSLPELPLPDLSGLVITLLLTGALMLWLVGNGILLRNPKH